MINKILSNELTFIIIDIAIGSLMAFFSILTYGKTKKISYLFFVLTALFLYIVMVFRVLKQLNIFILSELTCYGIPIMQYIVNDLPFLFMIIGFVLLLREK